MTRSVAILALPGVQLLDVSGPLDVFAEANLQAAEDVYRLQLVATIPGEIRSSSGARLVPDRTIRDLADESIDTLLVAGCPNAAEIRAAPDVISWLRKMAPVARRYGSVCTGTFFLAETGLLDGKHVTTHWAVTRQLAEAYPSVVFSRKGEALPTGRSVLHCTGPTRSCRAGALARLFMQSKIRAIGVSNHRCPSAKAFPCAAKDRLSIRQKFALSISTGISQSYGLLGLSDRRHLPVDFSASPPRRGIPA